MKGVKQQKSIRSLPVSDYAPTLSPLLKWAGGKRRLAASIIHEIGDFRGRYFEPFFGGGAVFFRLAPKNSYLSDLNEDLIECYLQVRDNAEAVFRKLVRMENTPEEYYRIRSLAPVDGVARAARMIYLTTLSFNGIYRQNLNGEFNVPYGHKTNKALPSLGELKRASAALANASITCNDFEKATASAKAGDVIYFDPPYTVAHNNNGFVKYNATIFSWEDQVRLSRVARNLSERGCKVIVSNADHDSVRNLYERFEVSVLTRPSVIAAAAKFRVPVTECLFVSPS